MGGSEIFATEYEGDRQTCCWRRDDTGNAQATQEHAQSSPGSWTRILSSAFLPEGYPDSVTSDYMGFQVWDSVQALCSYIRGMLTSQAMLVGVGMGQEAATPTAAVFQFLIRDLSGMVGGTAFAFLQGSDLDSHAKQWRLFADCFNNVGYALELASPVFPRAFLVMSCLGSIARAITGGMFRCGWGATRAALTQHFARTDNAGDVSAKEGSQETATTLVGMLLGMAFLHLSAGSATVIWAAFFTLTAVHIYANVRAVRSLRLTSLNAPRLQLLLAHALQHKGDGVLSPAEVAAREGLAAPPVQKLVQKLLGKQATASQVEQLCAAASDKAYLVHHHASKHVAVVLHAQASAQEELQAYAHGWVLLCMLQRCQSSTEAKQDADTWMRDSWQAFYGSMQKSGWSVQRVALGKGHVRAAWGTLQPAPPYLDKQQ